MRSSKEELEIAGLRPNAPQPAAISASLEYRPFIVYIDGYCVRCRRFAHWMMRLDRGRVFSIRSFRDDESYSVYGISMNELCARMFVVDCKTLRKYSGFEAIAQICRSVQIFWPSLPFLWVIRRLQAGEQLYDWLARNRVIIPHPGQCDEFCSRPPESPRAIAVDEAH